jgi:hypothetical protein
VAIGARYGSTDDVTSPSLYSEFDPALRPLRDRKLVWLSEVLLVGGMRLVGWRS